MRSDVRRDSEVPECRVPGFYLGEPGTRHSEPRNPVELGTSEPRNPAPEPRNLQEHLPSDFRLSINEVVHHHDVDVPVIRARFFIAGSDPDAGDPRVVEQHGEERNSARAR